MVITNGLVYTEEYILQKADLAFEGGRITQIAPAGSLPPGGAINAGGGFVLPGLVDIHTHGAVGHDFSDGIEKDIPEMLRYYGREGVTSVIATTMSLGEESLSRAVSAIAAHGGQESLGAVLRGINLEGPFLNTGKKGAQNPTYITNPDLDLFERLYALAGGWVKMVDIAPELPGSIDFIKGVARRCVVSLAHSNADYDESVLAFKSGATHVTHLFNAMTPFNHRNPGLVGAASDHADHVELIADGIHIHPSVVRSTFRWFGAQRVCLISDSIRGTGMPDGRYSLGEMDVEVREGRATLPGGSIAGSVANLAECVRRAVRAGVPLETAVRAATINPARAVGIDAEVGSLMPGKRADILIWDPELNTRQVILGGKVLDSAQPG